MAGKDTPTRRRSASSGRKRAASGDAPRARSASADAAQGPALFVALPATAAPERYPPDLTGYLEEWALHLDPVAEIVDLVTGGLGDWTTRGHVVSPVERALGLVRDAARREEVALAFRASEGMLLRPELGGGADVRIRATAHGDRLDSRALPLLLGLAVLSAEMWPVGRLGTELAARPAAAADAAAAEAGEPA